YHTQYQLQYGNNDPSASPARGQGPGGHTGGGPNGEEHDGWGYDSYPRRWSLSQTETRGTV
ncbi:hypothetical protein HK102_004549, partial [Quaeritorhiza haematococci]